MAKMKYAFVVISWIRPRSDSVTCPGSVLGSFRDPFGDHSGSRFGTISEPILGSVLKQFRDPFRDHFRARSWVPEMDQKRCQTGPRNGGPNGPQMVPRRAGCWASRRPGKRFCGKNASQSGPKTGPAMPAKRTPEWSQLVPFWFHFGSRSGPASGPVSAPVLVPVLATVLPPFRVPFRHHFRSPFWYRFVSGSPNNRWESECAESGG